MDPTRLPKRMFHSGLFDGSKKVNAYCNLSWIGTITSTSVLSEDRLSDLFFLLLIPNRSSVVFITFEAVPILESSVSNIKAVIIRALIIIFNVKIFL